MLVNEVSPRTVASEKVLEALHQAMIYVFLSLTAPASLGKLYTPTHRESREIGERAAGFVRE